MPLTTLAPLSHSRDRGHAVTPARHEDDGVGRGIDGREFAEEVISSIGDINSDSGGGGEGTYEVEMAYVGAPSGCHC